MNGLVDTFFAHIITILIFLPAIGALIVALIMKKSPKVAEYLSMFFITVELAIIIIMALKFNFGSTDFQFVEIYDWLPGTAIKYHVGVDGIGMVMLILTGIVCFIAAWTSFHQIPEEKNRPLYFVVFLLFEVGIIGTFVALNLIMFYLFWELVLPSMFLLIGKWGPHPEEARHAAIKFFIFTFAGSVIMLAGFIYLYMATGTFGMMEIAATNISADVQRLAFGLIFFGLAVKLPLIPFHTWLPDAHVEAPAPVSVLLAGLLLKMGGYGFVRMVWLLPAGFVAWFDWLLGVAVVGAIYSGLAAMGQDNFKRMVAYTSINHMSYVFLGCVAASWFVVKGGEQDLARLALAGSVFEMFAHGIAIGLMFLMAGVLLQKIGTYHISDLGGLGKVTPRISVLLLFGSLAVFGFPPLIIFVGEVQIFIGALGILLTTNYWPAVVVLVAPLIVVAAYLWAIRRIVMSEPTSKVEGAKDLTMMEIIPLAIICALIVLFGLFPSLITDYMVNAIDVHLGL
ncbi:MAG: NuoM family protein [Candidatus Njordarchaeota archaeon]